MEAGRFIKELLYQADVVRIPGLGTFVSTYQTASTDFSGRKISPPTKKFQFDDSRKEDDELMWSWISEQEGISEPEARMMVADFVSDINHEIHEGREVVIAGLGTFFADVTGKIEFHFSVDNNFNAESIGFLELDLPDEGHDTLKQFTEPSVHHEEIKNVPLITEAKIQHEEKIASTPTPKPVVQQAYSEPAHKPAPLQSSKSRKIIWISLTIIIIAALAFLAYEQRQTISDLTHTWFAKSKAPVVDTLDKKQKADTGIDITLSDQAKMKKALDVANIDSGKGFVPYGTRQMKFYIVAASFTKYDFALKLKDELRGKGFDSEIVTVTHKYYKVTMGSYTDKQQAQVELEKLKTITQNNKLWLMHI